MSEHAVCRHLIAGLQLQDLAGGKEEWALFQLLSSAEMESGVRGSALNSTSRLGGGSHDHQTATSLAADRSPQRLRQVAA